MTLPNPSDFLSGLLNELVSKYGTGSGTITPAGSSTQQQPSTEQAPIIPNPLLSGGYQYSPMQQVNFDFSPLGANTYQYSLEKWRENAQLDPTGTYIVADTNSLGEKLPYGALGWTYNGDPYYGSGLAGEWNKLKSKFVAPVGENTTPWLRFENGKFVVDLDQIIGVLSDEQKKKVLQELEQGQGEEAQSGEQGSVIQAQTGISPEAAEAIKKKWSGLYGTEGGMLTVPARAISVGITALLDTFQGAANTVEQIFSVAGQVTTVLTGGNYRYSDLAAKANLKNAPSYFLQDYATATGYDAQRYFKENFNPITLENVLSGNVIKKDSAAWKALQSGKIYYSLILDPMMAARYQQDINAGYSPEFLNVKYENPLAEFVGEAIFDPTNLLFGLGSGEKIASKVANKSVKVDGKIAKLLETIDVAGDADAISAWNKLAQVVLERNKKMGGKLLGLSEKLYADEGRYLLSQESKALFSGIIPSLMENPDNMAVALEGLIKITSKDPEEVMYGARLLKSIDGISTNVLFSDGATRVGLFMREMLDVDETGDILKATDKLMDGLKKAFDGGGVPRAIEYINAKIDNTIRKFIPTVEDRMKWAKMLQAGEIDKLTPRQIELAKSLGITDKTLYGLIETSRAVMKPFNTYFASVYMGLSPAYALRNGMQNVSQLFFDYGINSIVSRQKDRFLRATGGVIPDFAMRGFGAIKSADTMRVGNKIDKILHFASDLAAKFEEIASYRVTEYVYLRTMDKMLEKALPKADDLTRELNISKEMADAIIRTIQNEYDFTKAAEKLGLLKKGEASIDAIKTLSFLDEEQVKLLRDFNLYDELLATIDELTNTTNSASDIAKGVEKFFGNVMKNATREMKQVGMTLNKTDDIVEALKLDDVEDAAMAISETPIEHYLSTNKYAAISHAFEEFIGHIYSETEKAITEAGDMVTKGLPLGDTLTQKIEEMKQVAKSVSQLRAEATNASRNIAEELVGVRDSIIHSRKDAQTVGTLLADMIIRKAEKFGVLDEELKGLVEMAGTDISTLNHLFWERVYFPIQDNHWTAIVNNMAEAANNANLPKQITDTIKVAQRYQELAQTSRIANARYYSRLWANDYAGAIREMARAYGIEDERAILDILARYSEGNAKKYIEKAGSIDNIKSSHYLDDYRKAFAEFLESLVRGETEADDVSEAVAEAAKKSEFIKNASSIIPPFDGNSTPTMSRVLYESRKAVREVINAVKQGIIDNYGMTYKATIDSDTLAKMADKINKALQEARYVSYNTARAARDFSLLSYNKNGYDMVAGLIYPYQYWYSRTYTNWMKRVFNGYGMAWLSKYAAYKSALAKIHAGSPDWWKYNINTNELPGIEMENPLFFNLEATLNPLYGLLGVDFSNRRARADWLSATIDQAGKFGPSLFTPIQWLNGFRLYAQNEQEAARYWLGRLAPQTGYLASALWASGKQVYFYGKNKAPNEIDPLVQLSGGYDPYDSKRILRTLAELQANGMITPEQLVDAAYYNSGEAWNLAAETFYKNKLPGMLSSMLLGVGFKPRTVSDMQVDAFYNDLYRIMAIDTNLTYEERRQLYNQLFEHYPFGESILLGSKFGLQRDTAYSWNVLSRIQPATSDDIFRSFSANELLSKFYDNGGDLAKFTEAERTAFMNVITTLGAVLSIPDTSTKQEWSLASNHYKQIQAAMKDMFGDNINELLTQYNNLRYDYTNASSYEQARQLLEQYPQINQARLFLSQSILGDPLLAKYYAGISTISMYYDSYKNDQLMKQFGNNIFEIEALYFTLDKSERRKYLQEHPELKQYWDEKKKYNEQIDMSIIAVANMLPEGKPMQLRSDTVMTTQQDILGKTVLEALQKTQEQKYYEMPWSELSKMFSDSQLRLMVDYIELGKAYPDSMSDKLNYIASKMGIGVDRLLALMKYAYIYNR